MTSAPPCKPALLPTSPSCLPPLHTPRSPLLCIGAAARREEPAAAACAVSPHVPCYVCPHRSQIQRLIIAREIFARGQYGLAP